MLQILVRTAAIQAQTAAHRDTATIAGVQHAGRIMLMRMVLERGAERFNAHQRAAQSTAKPMLRDGRIATLQRDLFGPLGAFRWPRGWPVPPASVLHGLQLGEARMLSTLPDVPDRTRDPHSYWVPLHDGPPQERSFGDMAALAIYFDPLHRMEIVWLDREDALGAARTMLARGSREGADWRGISPDYAAWLQGNH